MTADVVIDQIYAMSTDPVLQRLSMQSKMTFKGGVDSIQTINQARVGTT
jgi:hypothetical protein